MVFFGGAHCLLRKRHDVRMKQENRKQLNLSKKEKAG